MDSKKNYKVRLNSVEKIEELLQEIYDQACRQINEIQIEINKLTVSTNLGTDETTMDDKAKYAKAIHDYIGDKTKAIAAKFEIAKFMGELVKHNGDLKATANDSNFKKRTTLNLKEIRDVLNEDDNDKTTYNLKNN
jgi:predicted YcjX-like family ATPase